MIFDRVVGHEKQIERLKKALSQNSKGQGLSYLFSGPSGVGKKLIAVGFAQGLLCQNEPRPCGHCSSCQRIEKGQHPDVTVISPSTPASFKIEQIREVLGFASLKSFEGRGKVVILNDAQVLTPQAANSLLKSLEEPSSQCTFILVTSNKAAVLPTIQSRCQKISFGSLSIQDVRRLHPETPDWTLEVSQGRLDLISKFEDDTYKKLKEQALRILRDLFEARLYEGFTALVPLMEDKETCLFTISCWGRWILEAQKIQLGQSRRVSSIDKGILETLAHKAPKGSLLRMSQRLLKLETDVQGNIHRALAFEKFWMDTQRELGAS